MDTPCTKELFRLNLKNVSGQLIERAQIFSLPFDSKEAFNFSGLEKIEYNEKVRDEIAMGLALGYTFVPMPFPVCAVEDKEGVVVVGGSPNEAHVAVCTKGTNGPNSFYFIFGRAIYAAEESIKSEGLFFKTIVDASFQIKDKEVQHFEKTKEVYQAICQDLTTAVISFCEELIYIEDPGTFIIRTREKKEKKKNKKHRLNKFHQKSIHIIKGEKELQEFYKATKGEETVAPHIRRGHWRYFWSDRFVNKKKGDRKRIQQTFVGDKKFEDGNNLYEVIIK